MIPYIKDCEKIRFLITFLPKIYQIFILNNIYFGLPVFLKIANKQITNDIMLAHDERKIVLDIKIPFKIFSTVYKILFRLGAMFNYKL